MPLSNCRAARHVFAALLAATASVVLAGQTLITPPPNNYPPSQDVQLGQQAAAEVEKQMPILHDDMATSYVRSIGERLVAAIPAELRHSEFRYTFDVVNVSDINAFALPGGPMFVNRGMMQSAHDEGEIAGVMAHELSHVVLRHGTAQASKATKYEIGQAAGAVLGAIIGGVWGNVIAQGTQFGLGAAFLRFSREYEKQADIEGSHIMARAGYDPRDMANMFRTIEQQGGPGGPAWLSDHPNPGDRYAYITEEARLLKITNPVRDTAMFERVESHLKSLPPAPTTEEVSKGSARGSRRGGANIPPGGRVEPPSPQFRTYDEGGVLRISVPANWRELPGSTNVTFAPEGAYGEANNQSVFTHGVEIGLSRTETHDLQTANDELLSSLAQGNPNLRRASNTTATNVGDRRGLRTVLSNRSDATGNDETIEVFTTLARNGNLVYVVAVAPSNDFRQYQDVFARVVQSIEIND